MRKPELFVNPVFDEIKFIYFLRNSKTNNVININMNVFIDFYY